MAKPYSEDLRRRVVEAIDSGATIPDAAEQCGVSISSVVRFLRLQRETGSVSGAKFGGYKEFALVAHEELVRSLIEEQPDITLAELEIRLAKKKVLVGKSSISRFLDHLELLSLLKNVIWLEIGSRVKIGMSIFINRMETFGVAGATWVSESNWRALHSYSAIVERNDPR